MHNVIYNTVIRKVVDSVHGETSHVVFVTCEVNGYALWERSCHDSGPPEWFYKRDEAIEHVVRLGDQRRKELTKDCP